MAKTVRQVVINAQNAERDLSRMLKTLESTSEGNSDLAWRIRDYSRVVERLVRAVPKSDRNL